MIEENKKDTKIMITLSLLIEELSYQYSFRKKLIQIKQNNPAVNLNIKTSEKEAKFYSDKLNECFNRY